MLHGQCSHCGASFYEGQEVYEIADLTLCENCVSECRTYYEPEEPGVDDAVDEWKDAHNGF